MANTALLQQALTAHQSGDAALAEKLYLEIINDPANASLVFNAKQLLGSLYSKLGNYAAAESYMTASLALQPNQSHVRNNLAVCYKRQGKFQQAMENFNLAISLQPDYLDAYKNLSRLFLDHQLFTQADGIATLALGVHPGNVGLRQQQALAKRGLKQYGEALKIFRELNKQAPTDNSINYNLAVTLRLNNNPTQALEIFENLYAISESPGYELLQNKGNAHADLGQLEPACKCFEQVISLNPNYVEAHENLKNIRWSLGQKTEFVDGYEKVIASGQSSPALQLSYVESLLTAEDPDRALTFLQSERCILDLNEHAVNDFKARCYLAKNDTSSAIIFHKRVCSTPETAVAYWIDYAITLIKAGNIDAATNILEEVCNNEPANQLALAHLSLCWRILGDPRAKKLNNFDLVREYELPTPPGFASLSAFNEALNNCLTEFHTSKHHPLEQTLRQGTQTHGNLFGRDHELLDLLQTSFREVIATHAKKMMTLEPPYPGFSAKRDFDFSASWSVRLRNQGFHTQHIHPMGWLSSAYYVDLPAELALSRDDSTIEDQGGWIKFGEPNLECNPPLKAEHVVRPTVGKLILFPSYMWHGTIPFKSEQTRTTVVFDVVPTDL
jgi:uncharacterized protein (TIGR02466 family)